MNHDDVSDYLIVVVWFVASVCLMSAVPNVFGLLVVFAVYAALMLILCAQCVKRA